MSTAVSFNTESQILAHSNSIDNLIHPKLPNNAVPKSKGHQSSFLKRRESGKVYDALTETSSIVTAFSDAIVENNGAFDAEITVSLPAKLATHTQIQTASTPPGGGTSYGSSGTADHRSNFRTGHESRQGSPNEGCKGSPEALTGWKGEVDEFSDRFILDSGEMRKVSESLVCYMIELPQMWLPLNVGYSLWYKVCFVLERL
jgi:hypothetical protein